MTETTKGLLYALGAFGLWGLSPVYWRQMAHVPALEILLHRIAWSAFFLAFVTRDRWGDLRIVWFHPIRFQETRAIRLPGVLRRFQGHP